MLPPPLNRGRSSPYGPIAGRVPVTPTELAGGTPVPEDDDMGMGGPDNPVAMTELVAPHRDLKRCRRQVDVMRMHMQRQPLDANQEEHQPRLLHQEYQASVLAMESSMSLQDFAEMQALEQHAQQWYHRGCNPPGVLQGQNFASGRSREV
eukprot:1567922-Amphidinium_carterae.1